MVKTCASGIANYPTVAGAATQAAPPMTPDTRCPTCGQACEVIGFDGGPDSPIPQYQGIERERALEDASVLAAGYVASLLLEVGRGDLVEKMSRGLAAAIRALKRLKEG